MGRRLVCRVCSCWVGNCKAFMAIATSSTTPTVRTADVSHRPSDRRAASGKQASSVTEGWKPVVTRTAYDQLARGGRVPEEVANLAKRRLCVSRCALGTTMMALANSMHDYRPGQAGLTPAQIEANAKVWQVLRAAHTAVEKHYLAFPLQVVD